MAAEVESYAHLVEVDAEKNQLVIHRLRADGSRQFFTTVKLPNKTFSEDADGFRKFASRLGENILVDSPVARSLLGL